MTRTYTLTLRVPDNYEPEPAIDAAMFAMAERVWDDLSPNDPWAIAVTDPSTGREVTAYDHENPQE
jgi:hypothetical protein